ncbi:unnamed protein product [Parascedosporium putredinis]|uniref:Uncharacterized protein n=1 Tax=Parascedosporium putredinis TaxID=1442378 RepID=A0A9P1M7Y8_9PEZI|nr:unnamed protein product [Parascedosporium putredinis]CAI7992596.1 unnamed protein product [Parascedosporium putredinis]
MVLSSPEPDGCANFETWKDIYFYASARESSLLQLAISVAGDLGLSTSRRSQNSAFASIVDDAAELRNDPALPAEQTTDGHRAILGLYYIMSIVLGQIATKVDDAFWETIEAPTESQLRNLYSLAIASVQKELDAFVEKLPDHLRWNHLVQNHCSAIRIRLFESFENCGKAEMLSLSQFRLDAARRIYNLPDTLHQLSKLFEAASGLESPRCKIFVRGQPIFSDHAKAYRDIEQWYLAKVKPGAADGNVVWIDPASMRSDDQPSNLELWNQLSILTNGIP